MGQVTGQQPGILWICLVAHIDRFAVVNQLPRANQVDLQTQCVGLFEYLEVIT